MSVDAGDGDGPAVALRAIYDELAACPDLRPGPMVDDAFRRLVRLVVDTPPEAAAAVLAHPAVRDVVDDLRSLCFEGEYQLEVAWARRIAESADPAAELGRFPFVANYRQLHALERDAVAAAGRGRRPAGDDPDAWRSSGRVRSRSPRSSSRARARRSTTSTATRRLWPRRGGSRVRWP